MWGVRGVKYKTKDFSLSNRAEIKKAVGGACFGVAFEHLGFLCFF